MLIRRHGAVLGNNTHATENGLLGVYMKLTAKSVGFYVLNIVP